MAINLAKRVAELRKANTLPGGGFEVIVNGSGLRYRGFTTRVGRGDNATVNANRSNSWGNVSAHVPLHSNAPGSGALTCNSTARSNFGALIGYQHGSGTLANRLKNRLESATPGTSDDACYVPSGPSCFKASSLLEISSYVNAGSKAYSETEFHTWNLGVNFLSTNRDLPALRIARAIDNHY